MPLRRPWCVPQCRSRHSQAAFRGSPRTPGWENETLATFLEAFGAWLKDCPGYYVNQRRALPSNAWTIVNDALNAATVYE